MPDHEHDEDAEKPVKIAKPPPGWVRKARPPIPQKIVKIDPLPERESELLKRFNEILRKQLGREDETEPEQ